MLTEGSEEAITDVLPREYFRLILLLLVAHSGNFSSRVVRGLKPGSCYSEVDRTIEVLAREEMTTFRNEAQGEVVVLAEGGADQVEELSGKVFEAHKEDQGSREGGICAEGREVSRIEE